MRGWRGFRGMIPRFGPRGFLALAWLASGGPSHGDEPAPPSSPLVRLMEGGKVPPERQPLILEQIGKRGSSADLGYVYRKALEPEGLAPTVRVRALQVLAEAATTRQLRPDGDPTALGQLLGADDPSLRILAARLAGLWKVEALSRELQARAADPSAPEALRAAALEALVAIGGEAALRTIEVLIAVDQPAGTRARAVASWAALNLDAAAGRVAAVLRDAPAGFDPVPLLAAFLNRQGGPERLAAVLGRSELTPDAARLALRGVYGLGRSDPALVDVLSRAAGLDAEVQPLDAPAMDRLIAEVASVGDAARGERVFRRKDLNCTGCHAVSGAGGNVGPDLSPIGTTSPIDYLANSVMLPDQAIKEQYQTLVVATSDGEVFQGIVADRDDARIVLREATGDLRSVPTADVEEQKPGGSLMPRGLVNLMTHAEFVDLLRFLSELGKPGPYAIRATPTIQRWRVFRDVPEILRDNRPESIQIHTELLNADPDRWAPAYSLVSGGLPLDDLAAIAGGPVLYLLGELDVTAAGRITATVEPGEGVMLWLNSRPAPLDGEHTTLTPGTGLQRLIVRVDLRERSRSSLRIELDRPPESTAQFTVSGGK